MNQNSRQSMSQDIENILITDLIEKVFEVDFSAISQRGFSHEEIVESDVSKAEDVLNGHEWWDGEHWTEVKCDSADQWLPVFIHQRGTKRVIAIEPIETFNMIFNGEFKDRAVNYTNKQTKDEGKWSDITWNELKTFIGILISMGIKKVDNKTIIEVIRSFIKVQS